MPRKPTKPFGHIAFSKQGKVTKQITQFPDNKESQETEIAKRFAAYLSNKGPVFNIERLPENDNDFYFRSGGEVADVLLELTELVGRNYLFEVSDEDLDFPNPRFRKSVYLSPGHRYGVDEVAKENLITIRIKEKIEKCYSKPDGVEFWLLLWTVQSDFQFEWWQGGAKRVSPAVLKARDFLERHGAGPFDQIWALYPEVSPCRIWPKTGG